MRLYAPVSPHQPATKRTSNAEDSLVFSPLSINVSPIPPAPRKKLSPYSSTSGLYHRPSVTSTPKIVSMPEDEEEVKVKSTRSVTYTESPRLLGVIKTASSGFSVEGKDDVTTTRERNLFRAFKGKENTPRSKNRYRILAVESCMSGEEEDGQGGRIMGVEENDEIVEEVEVMTMGGFKEADDTFILVPVGDDVEDDKETVCAGWSSFKRYITFC